MKLFLYLYLLFSAHALLARDFVVIKSPNCQFTTGIIVSAQDGIIRLSTPSGKIFKIEESKIKSILTYGLNTNAFLKTANKSKEVMKYFKKITIRQSKEVIQGFPFYYIEDLIFIHSTKGKIIVLSTTEISSIEDAFDLQFEISQNTTLNPDYTEQASECGRTLKQNAQSIPPTRVLGDNLKIDEYLSNYKKGERSFIDLQERTKFYAKPYLYPRRNRMGITNLTSTKAYLPFYYQWSTGEDFHFQSVNKFGGAISDFLPTYEVNNVFSSQFKSHFLHGYFEGNLSGFSSGTIPADYSSSKPNTNMFINNFNYYAFIGADWKNFSFSYGGGYFTPFITTKDYETRELSANALSSSVRMAYTTRRFYISLTNYTLDDKSSSSFEVDDQIDITSRNSINEDDITGFSYDAQFYRLSTKWNILEETSLSGDIITGKGSYQESGSQAFQVDFESSAYLITVARQFGHYITLSLYMKSETQKLDTLLGSTNKSFEYDETNYGGRFELLF